MNHAEYAGSLSQVLYRSTDIRKGLEDLFGQHSGRRVLLVAFIGEDWQAFMRPEAMRGMTVVCAPSPATSAIALIQMIALGAKIFFSPKLHMKVYWAEERGCIIGSANLSHNAMGEEGLKEVGVLLRPEAVDIDRLIAEADAVPATDQSLADLAKKNREAERALPPIFPRKSRTFLEWYRTDAIVRAPWKLGWWDEQAAPSTVSKNAAEEITGRRHIENHLECGKNHYKENDWILSFRLSSGTVDRAAWMFVDYVADVRKETSKKWPCEALQFRPVRRYGRPPFTVDAEFRRVFKQVAKANLDKIEGLDNLTPGKRLLAQLFAGITDRRPGKSEPLD